MPDISKKALNYTKNALGIFAEPTNSIQVVVSGSVAPVQSGLFDLGTTASAWRNIYGTSSHASTASMLLGSIESASYAISASWAPGSGNSDSASWASSSISASIADSATIASNLTGEFNISDVFVSASGGILDFRGFNVGVKALEFLGTASQATSASYAPSTSTVSASYATTASYAETSSYAVGATTAATSSAIYIVSGSGAWRLEVSASGELIFTFS